MKKLVILAVALAAATMLAQVSAVSELQLEWAFNTSDVFEATGFGAGHQSGNIIWDIDDDGVNEIVFGTRRGHSARIWCISQSGEFEWIYPPMDQEGLIGDPWGMSLVDVDGDGAEEICSAGRNGRLRVLYGDGTECWIWDNPTGANMLGPPQAYDVDEDGHPEFFMSDNDGYIYKLNHEGELVWTSFQALKAKHTTIADIDRDGIAEVLFASTDNNLYCISSDTGSEEWRFNAGASMGGSAQCVMDVNKDGEYEAIIWTDAPTSAVIVVSFFGTELGRWTEPYGSNIRLNPAIGDVDHDGNMDMALMSGSAIYVIDLVKLETKWEKNVTEWSLQGLLPDGAVANHWGDYPVIADIDGDQELEVLWVAPFPIVTDAATGELEAYYLNEHVAVNRRAENGGSWADVDQDGVSEWVVELNGNTHSETQVYCLTMGGAFPAEATWPEYEHCAYPGEYQAQQDWLTLKGAYSKGCWFKMPEILVPSIAVLLFIGLLKRRD